MRQSICMVCMHSTVLINSSDIIYRTNREIPYIYGNEKFNPGRGGCSRMRV